MDADSLRCILAECLPILGLFVVLPWILPSTRGYLFAFIFHLIIKLNSERATAVVKQWGDDGLGWWVKGDFDLGHMVRQLVKVTLEVHPQNGAPYSAQDRFSANPDVYYHKLKPGAEMQVAISRFNPAWVAVLPNTIAPNPEDEDFDPEGDAETAEHDPFAPSHVPWLIQHGTEVTVQLDHIKDRSKHKDKTDVYLYLIGQTVGGEKFSEPAEVTIPPLSAIPQPGTMLKIKYNPAKVSDFVLQIDGQFYYCWMRNNPTHAADTGLSPHIRSEKDEDFKEKAKRPRIHSIRTPKGQLEQLQQMLTAGLITQQDYDKKKDEILAKM